MADVKVRIEAADCGFYPDVLVSRADSDRADRYVKRSPVLVIEVLSASTAAFDIGDKVAASAPDLVISDYMMPGCNGLTVAKMVRKAQPALPVLIITSHRDPDILEQLRKQEVVEILHKPLDVDKLKEMVHADEALMEDPGSATGGGAAR